MKIVKSSTLRSKSHEALAQADPEQVMLDPASEAEVQRRIQTHEAGVGKTLSGEEFRRKMREKHGALWGIDEHTMARISVFLLLLLTATGTLSAQGHHWSAPKTFTLIPFHLDAARRGYFQTETYTLNRKQREKWIYAALQHDSCWVKSQTVPDTSLGFLYLRIEHRDARPTTLLRLARNKPISWQVIAPEVSPWYETRTDWLEMKVKKWFFTYLLKNRETYLTGRPYDALREPKLAKDFDAIFAEPFVPPETFQQDTAIQKAILIKALTYFQILYERDYHYPAIKARIEREIARTARQFAEAGVAFELVRGEEDVQAGRERILYESDCPGVTMIICTFYLTDLDLCQDLALLFNQVMNEALGE